MTVRKTERFEMRATTELLARIDEWRRQQPDLPNRSEAIRRLIDAGLSAAVTTDASGEGSGGKSKISATGQSASSRAKTNC
jgi:hypothetical protein